MPIYSTGQVIQNAHRDVNRLSFEIQNGVCKVFRFFAVVLCSLMLFRPVAAHDGDFVVGWIAGVDELSDEIILDDGKSFVVSPDINFEMLTPGTRVMLTFTSTPWGRVVVQIIPVPQIEPLEQTVSGV